MQTAMQLPVHTIVVALATMHANIQLVTLDLCGLDPSSLKVLFYAFGSCTNLTRIYVDATWALPSSGVSGLYTFYSCSRLVGGNGTAYSSGNVGYARMVIDRAGQAGYLTARS